MSVTPDIWAGDLVTSARVRLLGALVASGLLGAVVGRDPTGTSPVGAYGDGWVFPGLDGEGRPFREVEGTGKAAIVLLERDEWAKNPHNTAQFPLLRVLIYADTSRQPDGHIAMRDAPVRCRAVAKVVTDTFHDSANRNHWWPSDTQRDIHIVACVQQGGLSITDVPRGDGVVRGELRFEISR